MRIFLQKTDANDRAKNDKLPYFKLLLIPDEEGGDWTELGAFWKAKTGNGYSGKTNDGVVIDVSGVVPYSSDGAAAQPTSEVD